MGIVALVLLAVGLFFILKKPAEAKTEEEEVIEERAEFLKKVEEAGYTWEAGIPEAFFVQEFGPAWAWSANTPGRKEAMRNYWVSTHPGQPIPEPLL